MVQEAGISKAAHKALAHRWDIQVETRNRAIVLPEVGRDSLVVDRSRAARSTTDTTPEDRSTIALEADPAGWGINLRRLCRTVDDPSRLW